MLRTVVTSVGEVVGLALVTVGLWLVFEPAGIIFGGLAVGFVSFWNGRTR